MRFNQLKTCVFLSILLGLLCIFNTSYADNLNIELSSNKVGLDEPFTVSFTLSSNSNQTAPDFSAMEKDFRILGTSYGNAMNMVNGVTTFQKFWRLTLEAKRSGELTIPEIDFGSVKSEPRKIMVDKVTDSIISDKQDNAPVFVQGEVNTTNPYVQSEVLYTFKLYYQSQLESPRIEIPQTKDATIVQFGTGRNYQTMVKGNPYYVAEKNFVLYPQKTGKLTIPPTQFRALMFDSAGGRQFNSFYVTAPKTLSLATKPVTLNVRKVPQAFQGSTWLPAKNISITEKWSVKPDQWQSGNPVTRTITVQAQGLRADQLPDLAIDNIDGINVYTETPKRSNEQQGNSLVGILEQKVTYIPNQSQSFTLPAIKLNWWNIQTNTNATAQLNSVNVQVKGKIAHTGSNPVSATTVPAAAPAPVAEKSLERINPFYMSIWFWVASGFFVIWIITLGFIWRVKRPGFPATLRSRSSRLPLPPLSAEDPTEASFVQACEQGNSAVAQQFLLFWAKKQGQDKPSNLQKLCEIIDDDNFKAALENLEQAMYAKKSEPWNGQTLLAAYKQAKKQSKHLFTYTKTKNNQQTDPLPPLNPT